MEYCVGIAADFLFAAIGLILVAVLLRSKYVVHEYQKGIVERLGKYTGSPKEKGLHWRWPIIDKLVVLDMREQSIDFHVEAATSSDGMRVTVFGQIDYRVDPNMVYAARYSLDRPLERFIEQAMKSVTQAVILMTPDEALKSIEQLSDVVMEELSDYAASNGFVITDVGVTEIAPEESLQLLLDQRAKRARQLEMATTANNVLTAEAQANADAARLAGDAAAARIVALAEAAEEIHRILGVQIGKAIMFVLDAHESEVTGRFADSGASHTLILNEGSDGTTGDLTAQVLAAFHNARNASKPDAIVANQQSRQNGN